MFTIAILGSSTSQRYSFVAFVAGEEKLKYVAMIFLYIYFFIINDIFLGPFH